MEDVLKKPGLLHSPIKGKDGLSIEENQYEDFRVALQDYKTVWIHDTHDPELFEAEDYYVEYMS